ncbi:MAG: hypothetical protein ACRC7O_08715 [Fimbriiglobus sp.]
MATASEAADFAAVTKLGDLLLLIRQGFIVATSAVGEDLVYEGTDSARDLSEWSSLIAEGRVRIRVEWIEPND